MSTASDNDDDASGMAAAMGFSSFGRSRPSKKRRYNPKTDNAIVAPSSSSASVPPNAPLPSVSGANATLISIHMPAVAAPRKDNPDELSLDNDDLGANQGGEVAGGVTVNASPEGTGVVASSHHLPLPSVPGLPARPAFTNLGGDKSFTGGPSDRDPGSRGGSSFGGGSRGGLGGRGFIGGGRDWNGEGSFGGHDTGGRDRNPEWYVGYYDPASNENPWARLEAQMGLEPRGDWTLRPVSDDKESTSAIMGAVVAESGRGRGSPGEG